MSLRFPLLFLLIVSMTLWACDDDAGNTQPSQDTLGTSDSNTTSGDTIGIDVPVDTAGTDTAGTDTTGADTAGVDTSGTDTAGTDTAGTDTAGTDTAGADTVASDTGGDVGGPCATGLVSCNGACVDVQVDPANCGACGATCPSATPFCEAGQCSATCTGGTVCGDACVDLQTASAHCGSCDNTCAPGADCQEGLCCGGSLIACNGACVDTIVDPQNCGACGNACDVVGGEVCSVGTCTAAGCQEPLEACDGLCVDTEGDSAHCGGCNSACSAGEGCVLGGCEPVIDFGTPPAKCAAGGPPIIVEGGSSGPDCAGNIATVTFRWALCSCGDIEFGNETLTDGFDSSQGPLTPGGLGGGVGLNGAMDARNKLTVGGALWASGAGGLITNNDLFIGQELHVGGPWETNVTTLDDDAYISGDIDAKNTTTINGTLYHGGAITGALTATNTVSQAVTVNPPCDCDPSQFIDIAGIVSAHQNNNDNALINLDPAALTTLTDNVRVDIPCGEYYLTGINATASATIAANGRTALYIDGDIDATNKLNFVLGPQAELDLFVSGSVCIKNQVAFGSVNYPARMRVYVAGTNACGDQPGDSVWIGNQGVYAANFYAPNGRFFSKNSLIYYGAIFAGSYVNANKTTIHYDRGVLAAGADCPAGCPDGLSNCDGLCVSLESDPQNCGACGNVCPIGASCESGACVCPAGQIVCDGQCIDPSADPQNCGGCGTVCDVAGGEVCVDGACVDTTGCETPRVICDGQCISLESDPQNCGACGNVCPIGASCESGACVCPAGQIVCDGQCIDPSTDPRNCGGCNVLCEEPTPTCEGGQCTGGDISCTSCRDCQNQACTNGVCGECQTNADCCAPLVCVNNGRCQILN